MIRADWATPPDGDFARYVDQLMARAAQARLQASATPVEGFDGASRGTGSQALDPAGQRAGTRDGPPGQARVEPRTALADALAHGLRRWASPADARGWSGWLRERVRAAADAATAAPAASAPSRLYDPRTDRSPRKQ